MRARPDLALHNDLTVAVEQGMWDAGLVDPEDRTIARPGHDGVPKWTDPDDAIGAIVARVLTVFATHDVRPKPRR